MSDDEVVVVDKDGDFDGAAPESDDPSSAEECDDGGDDDEISGRPRKKARSTAAAVTPSGKKSKAKSSKGAASPAASAASSRAAAGGGKAGHAAPAAKKGGAAASAGSSSAGAAAGVGGPPGSLAPIAFKKANTVAEAEAILLSYLRRGNRPYSALQVFENLHGAVGKSVVPAVLDRLAESGQACAKSFGKFKLYWAEQSQFGETGKVRIPSSGGWACGGRGVDLPMPWHCAGRDRSGAGACRGRSGGRCCRGRAPQDPHCAGAGGGGRRRRRGRRRRAVYCS